MVIRELKPSKHVQGRWLAMLEDGSILRLSEREVADFALYAGMELDGAQAQELTAAAHLGQVKEKALDLLSARPMSRKELTGKLTARPRDREKAPAATAQEAETVAEWLERLGYLDDTAYAHDLAERYAAKGYGVRRVQDELYRRGVPRECWDAALDALDDPAEEIDAFLRKKLAGKEPDRKELKRASDALARRGYQWSDISNALRRYGAELEED